ncbi:MAG: HAMP domain-containing histidine kinase [Elusimicrobia bacterium]|nr:HAMP domain-containing histidine kinase [Elusimicrobiota bacterium]
MGAVAVLSRDNPHFSSPGILWAFAGLLAFNLAYQLALRRRGEVWFVPMVSMAVNTVLVTAVLASSGGEDSGFWPMYLLPIFTACLYLQARHVVMAAAFSCAFLGALHLTPADGEAAALTAAELAIKVIVLVMSAGVTSRFAQRERSAREALDLARADLDRLSADVDRGERARLDGPGRSGFMEGILYDVHARLAVILGSAEVLRRELGEASPLAEDAERIESAARALGRLTADVLRRRPGEDVSECRLDRMTEQVLSLVAHTINDRKIALETRIEPELPAARGSAPHVQQALLELVTIVCTRAKRGSRLSVVVQSEEHEVRARLRFAAPEESTPPPLAAQRRVLAAYGGDVRAFGAGRNCELLVSLPAASPRGVGA